MDNNLDNQSPTPAETQPVEPVPVPKAARRKTKKPVVVGLIVAAVLVVLGGGGAFAYNYWYQNPDKVLSDTFSKLASRDSLAGDAKMVVSGEEAKTTVELSTKILGGQSSVVANANVESGDMKFDIAGNAVYDKDGTLYVKVDNAKELFDTLISTQLTNNQEDMSASEQAMATAMVTAIFQPIVSKIDGQWIKVTSEEMTDNSAVSDKELTCASKAYSMFSDDKDARNEVFDVYKDHKFMVADEKLGSKDGNIGFSYTLDKDIAKDFASAVEQTKIGQKLGECETDDAKTEVAEVSDEAEDATVKLEIWVNRWTHQLASLKAVVEADDKQSVDFNFTPNYDEEVKIDVPTDAMTLEEATKDLGGLFSL